MEEDVDQNRAPTMDSDRDQAMSDTKDTAGLFA